MDPAVDCLGAPCSRACVYDDRLGAFGCDSQGCLGGPPNFNDFPL